MENIESISALTALVAVFVSPIITCWVTKRQITASTDIAKMQITASVTSENKKIWIDCLRNDISEFLALCLQLNIMLSEDETDDRQREVMQSPEYLKIDTLYLRIVFSLRRNEKYKEENRVFKERLKVAKDKIKIHDYIDARNSIIEESENFLKRMESC